MAKLCEIKGKTFLITGAASGLGAGYVEHFLKEGAEKVAVVDIDEDKGNALAEKFNQTYPDKVLFVKCDISNEESIEAAFNEVVNKFGTLDVIVNNAGILNDSPKMWRKSCEVNYAGLVSLTLKGVAHMRVDEGGKGGTIINVSSVLAIVKFPFIPIYGGTKAAVLHFSQSIAADPFHEQTGVRVLTICFGPTDTPLLENIHNCAYEEFGKKVMSETNHGQFQKPESAVKGVVEMYKQGANGSIWLVIHDRPVQDITKDVNDPLEHLQKKYDLV